MLEKQNIHGFWLPLGSPLSERNYVEETKFRRNLNGEICRDLFRQKFGEISPIRIGKKFYFANKSYTKIIKLHEIKMSCFGLIHLLIILPMY